MQIWCVDRGVRRGKMIFSNPAPHTCTYSHWGDCPRDASNAALVWKFSRIQCGRTWTLYQAATLYLVLNYHLHEFWCVSSNFQLRWTVSCTPKKDSEGDLCGSAIKNLKSYLNSPSLRAFTGASLGFNPSKTLLLWAWKRYCSLGSYIWNHLARNSSYYTYYCLSSPLPVLPPPHLSLNYDIDLHHNRQNHLGLLS